MTFKVKFTIFSMMMLGFLGKAQVGNLAVPNNPIVFRYDEAGNQIYRGYTDGKQEEEIKKEIVAQNIANEQIGEDEIFWNNLQIYPVPVKDVLTIRWTEEVNDLIAEVSLYEQNTIHWKFQQINLPNLNKQVNIDMTNYYMGVYVLTFKLKDGRVLSKNITKF